MGRMQRPKGFVPTRNKNKTNSKTEQTGCRNVSVVTPGMCELEDSKTLEQAWVRYLRLNSKMWVRYTQDYSEGSWYFWFGRHPEAKFFQCGNIAGRHFEQQRRTPQSCMYMGSAGVWGGTTHTCMYIYIYIYNLFLSLSLSLHFGVIQSATGSL